MEFPPYYQILGDTGRFTGPSRGSPPRQSPPSYWQPTMAKTKYTFEKRQRDLAKKKKKEEKLQRKLERKAEKNPETGEGGTEEGGTEDGATAEAATGEPIETDSEADGTDEADEPGGEA